MNSGNKLRIALYILAVVGILLIAEWKKSVVLEKKNQEVVSLPNEFAKHGKPVDVEQLQRSNFNDIFRVGINKAKAKSVVYLTKNEASKIKVGQVLLHPETGESVGSVKSVSGQAQLSTGLFLAELELDKEKINGSPYVDIVIKAKKNSISISLDAILKNLSENNAQVFVVDSNNAAEIKSVQLGLKSHNKVEILEGLSEGEKVVVNGQKFLEAGDKLRLRECVNCENQNSEVSK